MTYERSTKKGTDFIADGNERDSYEVGGRHVLLDKGTRVTQEEDDKIIFNIPEGATIKAPGAKTNGEEEDDTEDEEEEDEIKEAQDMLAKSFALEKSALEAFNEAQIWKIASLSVLKEAGQIGEEDIVKIASMTFEEMIKEG